MQVRISTMLAIFQYRGALHCWRSVILDLIFKMNFTVSCSGGFLSDTFTAST